MDKNEHIKDMMMKRLRFFKQIPNHLLLDTKGKTEEEINQVVYLYSRTEVISHGNITYLKELQKESQNTKDLF